MSTPEVKRRKITIRRRRAPELVIPAWDIRSGRPGPGLLLTAAQHGNEVQGAETIRRFVALAGRQLVRGRVFAAPLVNLPAIRERRPHIRMKPEQPYADDRGHNMNRWWPGDPGGNDSARVPAALERAFAAEASHLLDFHCWPAHRAPALLIGDVPQTRRLAEAMAPRFVSVRPPPAPGRRFTNLRAYFESGGRCALTYEFSGQYLFDEKQVAEGLRLLLNYARLIGLMPGQPEPGAAPVLFSDRYDTVRVRTPLTGLFVPAAPAVLGGAVSRGQLLGHVISPASLVTREIKAPAEGYLLSRGSHRPGTDVSLAAQHPCVNRGETVAGLAVPRPGGTG